MFLNNSKFVFSIIVLTFGLILPDVLAQDGDMLFRIKRNATSWGKNIVRKYYDGGIDIETKVLDAAYSKTKKVLWVKLGITFNGVFGGPYQVIGEYEEDDKGKWTWKSTSMNGELKSWLLLKGLSRGAANARKQREEKERVEQIKAAERIRAQAEKRYSGSVYASKLEPKTLDKNRSFLMRGLRFQFMESTFTPFLVVSNPTPPLEWVAKIAVKMKSNYRREGEPYFRSVLKKNQVMLLKQWCWTTNTYSYLAVYRSKDDNFYYTLPSWKKWYSLAEGKRLSYSWKYEKDGKKAKAYIEFARPNKNEDSTGGQVDYRFRIVPDYSKSN